jgi:threonine dehydratase
MVESTSSLDPVRIERALGLIDPLFMHSPVREFHPLSQVVGATTLLKLETLNPIRSFKGRGTDLLLATDDDGRPLVCASAGNFGQGLAWAARKQSRQLRVFAARAASPLKVQRMRELGATVELVGADFDEAKSAARESAGAAGHRFVEDGRLPQIAEGAGTIAVEMTQQVPDFTAVYVPVGNGSLIAGIGCWLKHARPQVRVVGVVASGAPAMALAWRTGRPESTAEAATIADGIAVRVPVPEAVRETRLWVDEMLEVSDADIISAMRLFCESTGLLVEPAGIAGLAGALSDRARIAGATVVVPVCGSNITLPQLSALLHG